MNDIIKALLRHIGEDPDREGLRETPARVMRAWSEWATGYRQHPDEILYATFSDGAEAFNEMVIVDHCPVVSKCEHHLADMIGYAHVGYIPNGKIVGLSKIPRLVDCFARRLQVQERLTTQIADAMMEHLTPHGVGVLIRCSHACMSTRGVKVQDSMTTTSCMRGAFFDQSKTRKEFLHLCAMAEKKHK
jgi:GTP cyclohydrolase IA